MPLTMRWRWAEKTQILDLRLRNELHRSAENCWMITQLKDKILKVDGPWSIVDWAVFISSVIVDQQAQRPQRNIAKLVKQYPR